MRVQTFWLIIDYGYGNRHEYRGISRVALERFKEWYREESAVFGMSYGKEN